MMGIFNNNSENNEMITKGYFYQHLPENLKAGYDAVAGGIVSFQKKIQVAGAKSKKDVEKVLDAVIFDNPLLCYFNPNKFGISSIGSYFSLNIEYIYDRKKAMQIMKQVDEKADFIIDQFITEDMTDYEKCLAIHDYMTENIGYNFSALSVSFVYDAFTVEGAIFKHQAVCSGIAKAIALLLHKLGITCLVVSGTSDIDENEIGHAWNIVKLGDKYYHIDATWDLQEVNHFTSRSHMYMNLDDESILMNHTWELEDYPTCNSEAENYYVKAKRYFRTMRSFELYVQKFLKAKLKYMDVRFASTLVIPDDRGKMLADIIKKTAQNMGLSYQISFLFNSCNYVFQAEIHYS